MKITPSDMRLVYLVGFPLFAVFLVFHVGTKHRKAVMRRALGSFLLCLLGFTGFALQIPAVQTLLHTRQAVRSVVYRVGTIKRYTAYPEIHVYRHRRGCDAHEGCIIWQKCTSFE